MQKLKKRLLNLAIGEFVALIAFILVYRSFDLGRASLFAILYLLFILLQGSLYWFYRYRLILDKRKVGAHIIKILRFTRRLNLILLIIIGVSIPFIHNSLTDLITAIVIFIFGAIEYINYYWYRLSYGKTGFNLKILLNTKLQKSSIHKLISKLP